MEAEGIFSEIKDVLENDETLSKYVKIVFAGDRPCDSRHLFPNITIEVTGNPLLRVKNNRREMKLQTMIAGAVLVQNADAQIIGNETIKGVMDIEADIYSALYAVFPDLNENCLYFELSTVGYPELESANGRVVLIQAEFYYMEAA